MTVSAKPLCGAKTRAGTPCRRPAGWGTDHVGQGKCKLHGGATPIKTGRYSTVTRPRIKELIDQFEDDPTPLDLLPEVKLLRALVLDFIERYDEFVGSMHAWHSLYDRAYQGAFAEWREKMLNHIEDEGWENIEPADLPKVPDPLDYVTKPRQVLDISAAATLVDRVGAMVDRVEKHKQQSSITLETLDRVLEQLGMEVVAAAQKHVPDPAERTALLQAIEQRWHTIPVTNIPHQGNPAGNRITN